ncbi:MAG: hypothetical protein EBY11_08825 [Proteobacteria bacterium]|nr:hypothetical protein [Pseudomonadota bacterium]
MNAVTETARSAATPKTTAKVCANMPAADPQAVARPAPDPWISVLRKVSAVSGPGVTAMTSAATRKPPRVVMVSGSRAWTSMTVAIWIGKAQLRRSSGDVGPVYAGPRSHLRLVGRPSQGRGGPA